MNDIIETFGSMVFNERVMKERLPKEAYESLLKAIAERKHLDEQLAEVIAEAMKNWAMENGATHYTHWFQPLTGMTSEKHDSFLDPVSDGTAIAKFSGKNLIQGEPDASSFPNGGLRTTFEARGYTAWDPTSYAFIKDEVLCIPTAFVSFTGEVLDKKTPLLRAMEAISKQANRVMALFGEESQRISVNVGAEQEYFLIPLADFEARQDLVICGRTLFGYAPCKGQELEEHYFGSIRPVVNEFMKDLNEELWKLGVSAKTKHNEVAPCQHELAPVFTDANRAVDGNLLTMEKMNMIAERHGLACLLHEKPFAGINGSGKHNNWSISAGGKSLLDSGEDPMDNLRFLVFLTGVIQAVDDYQDLLRMSVASAGNDLRLGANEAPPAIVSIFLGTELSALVDALIDGTSFTSAEKVAMDMGTSVLPALSRDNTDRNRTSPFAFTGNKFEFRMPGSSVNLADANTILTTAMAKSLKDFADAMEGVGDDFEKAAIEYIRRVLKAHRRIIFNGNGYSDEWIEEAKRRGLCNYRNTAEALPCFVEPKNIALFEEMGILSEHEIRSRYEVKLEKYNKIMNIEARTMKRMVRRDYLPAINAYAQEIAQTINAMESAIPGIELEQQTDLLNRLSQGIKAINKQLIALDAAHQAALKIEDQQERANHYAFVVRPIMDAFRIEVDSIEKIVSRDYWPVSTYDDILFYVSC
ncbi:MAG: glutamine synthetase III [Eggerthellaceae bacterium]|nr:glutamine synthetase III [Eggerthellaceae bacterium]